MRDMAEALKNYNTLIICSATPVLVALSTRRQRWMMRVGATDRQLYRLRRWFTFPYSLPLLSESWLLLIIRCHHSVAIAVTAATHRCLLLLLLVLLLLGRVEAVHLNLLVVHVKVIVLLIRIHFLMNELVRCRHRRGWLHHLAGVLKCAHASVAHDLTAMTAELRVLSDWRRLVNEILRSLESIALIARPQHEPSLLIWWGLQVELTERSHLVQFRWFQFLSHTRRVIFRFNCDCRVDEKSDAEC